MPTETIRQRRKLIPWIIGVAAIATFALGFVGREAAASRASSIADGDPVVLELFTSQGCSSCPPADALLSEIGSTTKGVIPLAYHVDYWNHLGWSDPFSSRQFSQRQSAYAAAMNLDGDYTPQMVIGGDSQCIGSDSRSIERAVAAARNESDRGQVTVHASSTDAKTIQLTVNARPAMQSRPGSTQEVIVAIFENGLVTKIGGGENGGRKITYDYTVRRLLPALELNPAQGGSVEKHLRVDLDPAWSIDNLGVAAFIQDTESLRILGAASQYPITRN
jgi:hypothetical protein